MKIKIPKIVEEDVTHVYICCQVDDEEEMPFVFPGRSGGLWKATINLDTGKIGGWPQGESASLFLTVRDSGTYSLLAEDGRIVAKLEDDYVPNLVIPGKYGDTIELNIASDGTITNWHKNPDFRDFIAERD